MIRRHATPRRQRGDINTGTAVAITVLLLALLAWWMYWPETIPVFGQRPEAELAKPRDGRADTPAAVRAKAAADANKPLYKWQDEHGQWHITDRAPKDRPYEKVVVDPGTNVIPPEVPDLPSDKEQKKPD
jgi:hypothetical protein